MSLHKHSLFIVTLIIALVVNSGVTPQRAGAQTDAGGNTATSQTGGAAQDETATATSTPLTEPVFTVADDTDEVYVGSNTFLPLVTNSSNNSQTSGSGTVYLPIISREIAGNDLTPTPTPPITGTPTITPTLTPTSTSVITGTPTLTPTSTSVITPPTSVPDVPIISSLGADPILGEPPLVVNFSVNVSAMSGETLSFVWNFGDGSILVTGAIDIPASGIVTLTNSHQYMSEGEFTTTFSVTDSGNRTASSQTKLRTEVVTQILTNTPSQGEGNVSVTRETVIRFSAPLDPATVTSDTIRAEVNGVRLDYNLHLSLNHKEVTLFYTPSLPTASRVRVVVDGERLIDNRSRKVDADHDGLQGGAAYLDFDTVSQQRIPGTQVWGYVYDSYTKNPDGSDIPLAGVTIRVDGIPEANAVTDQNGYFILQDMPAPIFFVHIDGSTATNAPNGVIYATVGKAFHSVAGQTRQLFMDGVPFNVYLPPMTMSDMQPLKPNERTDIKFGTAGKEELQKLFPGMAQTVWDRTTVSFPPNSAMDESGKLASQAVIVPVPADRLPAPLPPGMNHQLDIAVIAPGATNFDTPAPACFPNLPDKTTGQPLPPGGKSALISFNHDTGQWEVVGPMTVSADGQLVCTDPGVGIRAPGWHGAQNAASVQGGGVGGPPPDECGKDGKPCPCDAYVKIVGPTRSTEISVSVGSQVTFKAFGSPGGDGNFEWMGGQAIGDTTSDTYTAKFPDKPTKMTVSVVTFCKNADGSKGGSAGDQKIVNVIGGCKAEITGPNVVHVGQDAAFSANVDPSNGKYKWHGGSPDEKAPTNQPYYVTKFPNPTSHEIIGLEYACPEKKGQSEVTVTASHDVKVIDTECSVSIIGSNKQLVGADESLAFAARVSGKGGTFQWSGGESTNTNGKVYVAKFATANTSTIVTVSYTCADGTMVSDSIVVSTTGSDENACKVSIEGPEVVQVDQNDIRTFTANGYPSSGDYNWTGGTPESQSATNQNTYTTKFPNSNQTDIVAVTYTCSDGTSVSDSVVVEVKGETKRLTFHGLLGDVVKIDLSGNNLWDLRINPMDQGSANLLGEVAAFDNWQNLLKDLSVLYFVPYQVGTSELALTGKKVGEGENEENLIVEIYVTDGYSTQSGANPVTFNSCSDQNSCLDTYTQQQRLKYLNYPATSGANFEELVVDGKAGQNTRWAIDVFNRAVTLKWRLDSEYQSMNGIFTSNAKLFLNSTNAPFWKQITIPGNYRYDTIKRWGTSWAEEVLQASTYTPPNTYTIQRITEAGGSTDSHGSGMAVDVDVPVLQNSGCPAFFAQDSTNRIRTKSPNSILIYNRLTKTFSSKLATAPLPSGWIEITCDLLVTPLNNDLPEYLTDAYKSGLLILNPNYDQQEVKRQIDALINTVTSSGAHVSGFYWNDPYFYTQYGGKVVYWSRVTEPAGWHNGHYHVIIAPPGSPSYVPALQAGLIYFAITEPQTNSVIVRGKSVDGGMLHGTPIMLAPDNLFVEKVLVADSLFAGEAEFVTAGSGKSVLAPDVLAEQGHSPDSDSDGLHDEGEFIVGTDPANPDSDGDGLLDGDEVRNGSDPLDGKPARTGIIATVDTPGNAQDICARNDLAAVADGATGVAIFDIRNPDKPMLLSQVDTPGEAKRVACDGNRVAVADGSQGLAILDISNPTAARRLYQVRSTLLGGLPQTVVASGGIGYVGLDNGKIVSIDLTSGTILDRGAIDAAVQDLAIADDTLYALSFQKLHLLPLNQSVLTPTVATNVADGSFRLFVGGGIAYVMRSVGYSTYDVSKGSAPTLIAEGNTGQNAWAQIVPNSSGLGVAAMGIDPTQSRNVHLYDLRDPTKTNQFITTFNTPGQASAIALYNGFAYVADGDAGLHVVNYLAYDIQKTPPTITLSTNYPPGQAEEGQQVRVSAVVSDDVQVRSVEFFVDGVKVATDGNFPFEHRFVAPRRAQEPSFVLRANAWDTGGNMSSTGDITITLTADTVAPRLLRLSPRNNDTVGNAGAVAAFFNEPLDPASLTSTSFTLLAAGADNRFDTLDDSPITTGTLEFRNNVLGAFLTVPSGLPPGRYRASVTTALRDVAGNALSNGQIWSFRTFNLADDNDADCVPNTTEPLLGLDPNNPDTDGDGINDGGEDFDEDGLSNCNEVIMKLDPANPDSDGDGILDGEEDYDDDGLANAAEISVYRTDPFNDDTDGDSYEDGIEVFTDFDPLNPESHPYDDQQPGEAVSPPVVILNMAVPVDPGLMNEAVSPAIVVLNTDVPSDPNLLNETVSSPVIVLNTAVPSDTSLLNEAVSPAFTLDNNTATSAQNIDSNSDNSK